MNHEYESRKKGALGDYFDHKNRALQAVLSNETLALMNEKDYRVYDSISKAMTLMNLSYQKGRVAADVYPMEGSERFLAVYKNERNGDVIRITNNNPHCFVYQLKHSDGSREEFLIDTYLRTYRTIPRHMPVVREAKKENVITKIAKDASIRIQNTLSSLKATFSTPNSEVRQPV